MCSIKKYAIGFGCLAIIAGVLLLIATGCSPGASSEKIAVKINNYSITPEEFNELFFESGIYEDTAEARRAFMENLITRKLLLQEAQRENLDKQKAFLKSIENFWEEGLLAVVIDKKTREVSHSIGVTEEELKDFYYKWAENNPENSETLEDLQEIIKWQLIRKKQHIALTSWISTLKNRAKIEIDKKAIGVE